MRFETKKLAAVWKVTIPGYKEMYAFFAIYRNLFVVIHFCFLSMHKKNSKDKSVLFYNLHKSYFYTDA
jgi:hypothetical protein